MWTVTIVAIGSDAATRLLRPYLTEITPYSANPYADHRFEKRLARTAAFVAHRAG